MMLDLLGGFAGQAYGGGHFAQAGLGQVALFGEVQELLLYRMHVLRIIY